MVCREGQAKEGNEGYCRLGLLAPCNHHCCAGGRRVGYIRKHVSAAMLLPARRMDLSMSKWRGRYCSTHIPIVASLGS